MPSRKSTTKKADESPTFEEALEGLEEIVEAMENEQLPLEDLVAYYEKGSKLMAHCESVLESAKGRIELITLRNQSDSVLENSASADDASPATPSSGDSDESDNDDIRLF